jgi:tetratricopeptide (TPR) repeat protein
MPQENKLKNIIGPAIRFLQRWQIPFLAGLAITATFISFSPTLRNSFINWDDNTYVYENANLGKPLFEAIRYFFGPHYFSGNYMPLTMIGYTLEYHIAGVSPGFYHTVNLLIHLANVLLVFWFAWLLSGKKPLVAALVSLFFGIHPMHVESVAWISELKDVLYAFFFICGLIAYYKYTDRKRDDIGTGLAVNMQDEQGSVRNKGRFSRFPVVAFVFFIFSAFCKPAAASFPLVLLLLDFYTFRKFNKQVWLEKLPFFIVSFIFGVIAIKSQQADHLLHDFYPFSQKLVFATYALLAYLAKFFLPINLSAFYPYPSIADGGLPYFYYICPLIVALLCYGVYRTLKYGRLVAFGSMFFLANVILVLQFVSVGNAIMAERYTYISYIGLLFIIAMGFDRLYQGNKQKTGAWKQGSIIVVFAVAIMCSYLTCARCEVWENADTFAADLLSKYPDDYRALNNKGLLLFSEGSVEESKDFFSKAVRQKPDYITAYINLMNSYLALKDYDGASKVADLAQQYAPKDVDILIAEGHILALQHKYSEATAFLENAVALKKDDVRGYLYLADCYYALQDYNNWVQALDSGLKYAPNDYILLNSKGYALTVKGNYTGALPYFKASLKINPDFTTAATNLSACYRVLKDTAKGGN